MITFQGLQILFWSFLHQCHSKNLNFSVFTPINPICRGRLIIPATPINRFVGATYLAPIYKDGPVAPSKTNVATNVFYSVRTYSSANKCAMILGQRVFWQIIMYGSEPVRIEGDASPTFN